MIHPKKADQAELMGKRCTFTGELARTYLKKQIHIDEDMEFTVESVPVRWKEVKHKLQFGWIVGFGWCYDGTIKEVMCSEYTSFQNSKMVKYVRVRLSTEGREIKVLANSLRLV